MLNLKILLCSARSPKYDVLRLASRRATAAMMVQPGSLGRPWRKTASSCRAMRSGVLACGSQGLARVAGLGGGEL